jgi:hypothetical protein
MCGPNLAAERCDVRSSTRCWPPRRGSIRNTVEFEALGVDEFDPFKK